MDSYLILLKKVYRKKIKELNLRSDTIKPLEQSVGKKLIDISPISTFLDIMPKATTTKEKKSNKTLPNSKWTIKGSEKTTQ